MQNDIISSWMDLTIQALKKSQEIKSLAITA